MQVKKKKEEERVQTKLASEWRRSMCCSILSNTTLVGFRHWNLLFAAVFHEAAFNLIHRTRIWKC